MSEMAAGNDETRHDPGTRQAIGKALGKVPSGVYILTATHEGQSSAMIASWVQQAGFEPPAISMAIGKDRPVRDLIDRGRSFAICVLGKNDTSLMKRYARGVAPGEDAFAGVATIATAGGQVALCDSIAWLECRLLNVCDYGGDHDVLVAAVIAGAVTNDGPSFTHLRGNGYRY